MAAGIRTEHLPGASKKENKADGVARTEFLKTYNLEELGQKRESEDKETESKKEMGFYYKDLRDSLLRLKEMGCSYKDRERSKKDNKTDGVARTEFLKTYNIEELGQKRESEDKSTQSKKKWDLPFKELEEAKSELSKKDNKADGVARTEFLKTYNFEELGQKRESEDKETEPKNEMYFCYKDLRDSLLRLKEADREWSKKDNKADGVARTEFLKTYNIEELGQKRESEDKEAESKKEMDLLFKELEEAKRELSKKGNKADGVARTEFLKTYNFEELGQKRESEDKETELKKERDLLFKELQDDILRLKEHKGWPF